MRGGNFSLSGKISQSNGINLTGRTNKYESEPIDVQHVKLQIMSTVLFPIISQQWVKVMENRFFIASLKAKINDLHLIYGLNDLLFYKDVLLLAEAMIAEHEEVNILEKKLYGKLNDVGTIVFRTKMIKLKAEYEIYNFIIGKPLHINDYNLDMLHYIQQLTIQENMTFDKIKSYVLESNIIKNLNTN